MNTKTYTLRRETFVRRRLETVFEFFARPENLQRITPSWLDFNILTPSPVSMRKGALIDYTIRIAGIRVRWQTVIRAYEPPCSFVDEQRSGPYAFWHHTHTFAAVEGGTRITDEVNYRLPFGFLGRIVHGLVVHRQLKAIFDYRKRAIDTVFTVEDPEPGRKRTAPGNVLAEVATTNVECDHDSVGPRN